MKITKFASKGFSLVEMLVVIAIIGIIAAVAVPQISGFTSSAEDSRNKRNAQTLVSTYAQAQAAGLDLIPDGETNKTAAVDAVIAGDLIDGGAFDGQYFGVPNMEDSSRDDALEFLKLENGMLQYVPAGGQQP